MELKQGVVQIFPATVRIPCDIWGCRSGQMASHFLGRPENPKNVLTNLCPTCLEQLKESVMAMVGPKEEVVIAATPIVDGSQIDVSKITAEVVTKDSIVVADTITNAEIKDAHIETAVIAPDTQEPGTVDVLEIDGKLITDFTVRELKELCQEEKIVGYSNKDKDELIDLITAHFEKSEE